MTAAAKARSGLPLHRAFPFSALLFLLVGAHSLLETARDSLFLTGQPISRLPWVFLGVTAGVLALTPIQRRLWAARHRSALTMTLAAAGAVTLLFWAARASPGAVLLFYVWTALFSSVVFVQFWLTADEAFRLGEAKRIFGFIGAGGVLGAVAGSGAARLALQFAPPGMLMPGSAAVTFVAAVLANVITAAPMARVAEPEVTVARVVPSALRRDPYLRLLAVLALLTATSATLLDYLFKAAVVDTTAPDRIPRLIANVNVAQSVLAVGVELFLVRLVLSRAGVTRSLALLPALFLAGTAGYALTGTVAALFALKMLDGGLRPSMYRVGTELLFLPVRPAERRVFKPSIDTLGPRVGQALASLVLLAIPEMHSRGQLMAVTLVLSGVALVWVWATWTLRAQYLVRFQQQLGTGAVEMGERSELDLSSAEILVAALGSFRTAEVLTSLELLARGARPGLIPALILYHPDRAVVTAAMRHFAGAPRPDVDAMLPFLVRHADPEVRATAVGRWLTAGKSVDQLRPFLEDPAPRVRASALIALAGASHDDPSFRHRMFSIAREGTDDDRRALAWAIATAPRPDLLRVVTALFSTGDVETRRELLRAVREFPAPPASFVSQTVEMLTDASLRTGIQDSLLSMGQPAREYLKKLLLSDTTSFVIARELPAALAKFPPDEAAPVLLQRLAQPRGGLDRFRSLRALNQLRRTDHHLPLDRGVLGVALDFEIAAAVKDRRLRTAGERLGIAGPTGMANAGRLLLDLLQDKETRALERVFRTLDLLFARSGLERVYLGLRSVYADRRDAAREVLVELLPPRVRGRMVALLGPEDSQDTLRVPVEDTPESFVSALLQQSSELVRLLTPCVAEERGWVAALPALRTGPRCVQDQHAARAEAAIRKLESRDEAVHA